MEGTRQKGTRAPIPVARVLEHAHAVATKNTNPPHRRLRSPRARLSRVKIAEIAQKQEAVRRKQRTKKLKELAVVASDSADASKSKSKFKDDPNLRFRCVWTPARRAAPRRAARAQTPGRAQSRAQRACSNVSA